MKSRPALFVCVLLSLVFPCDRSFAQSQPDSGSRIVAPVDESRLVILRDNVHPLAQARFDRGPALGSMPAGHIRLLLHRSATQQQALAEYLSGLQDPSSANYHKWLTPAQYGAKFGADTADIKAVESWLRSHGLRIENAPASQNLIEFSGTIDQVQNAFHTSIHAFAVHGETRFANVTDPRIPAALAPVIAAVGPLNNFRPQPGARIGARGTWDKTARSIQPDLTLFDNNQNPYLFVDPADAATIYDSPNSALNPNYTAGTTYSGNGVTIGIVGVSNVDMQDIQNYRTGFLGESTTSANLPTVIVDGNDPGIDAGGAGLEAVLDNEVAGGMAPGAHINFYISAGSDLSDGLLNAIYRAVGDNAVDILSVSFGECESALGNSENQIIQEATEQAAAQGISVVVSAGDNGSAGCDNFDTATTADHGLGVSGFASTPYTIAVGGTDFDVLPSSFSTYASTSTSGTAPYYRTATQYIPEKPWNNSTSVNSSIAQNAAYTDSSGHTNIVAGSGGLSSIYAKPAFQSALTPADGHRDLPDVSLLAGNGFYSAVWVVCSDSLTNGTGTGAVSDCANNAGQFYNSSTFSGVGGTSASAPAFAGILALVEQATGGRLGQANTVLYQLAHSHPAYFHDISSGDNSVPCASGSPGCGANGFLSGYDAGAGYDLATGLGSVDAAAIVTNWKSVSLGSTSTTLQINGSTAAYSGVHGAALTLSTDVTSSSGTPTGFVAVTDNASLTPGGAAAGPQSNGQTAIPLTSGSGSASYNGLPGGSYQVSARYGGDTTFAASSSTPISVTISAEASTTSLSINAYNPLTGNTISGASFPYGSYVLADAAITGTAEGSKTQGVATGTVTFLNGGSTLATGAVSSGNQASWPPLNSSFSPMAAGTYNLTASYSGDASYLPSSGTAVFTVAKAPTTVSAGYSGTPVQYGNDEQIVADVLTKSTGIAPTGTFQFYADGQPVAGPQSIYESGGYSNNNGNNNWAWADATTTYAYLSVGQHTLSATYSGDTNYAAGTAPAISVAVTQAVPIVNGYGFENPQGHPIITGQSATAIASVFGAQHGVAPTGTVTFYDNGVALTDTVSYTTSGNALNVTMHHVFTSAGTRQITVGYSGDANYTSTTSMGAQSLTVLGPFGLSVGSLNALEPGQSGSASVTVTPNGGFTGGVNLSCTVSATWTGYKDLPTCSIPSPVTISGTAASTAKVTVSTTAAGSAALNLPLKDFLGGGTALAALFLFGIPARRRRWGFPLCLIALVVMGAIGCGGSSGGSTGGGGANPGTTPGTYTVTVTGTDAATGKITASATVDLTVN